MEFILVLLLGYFKSQIGLKRKGSLQGAAQGSIRVFGFWFRGFRFPFITPKVPGTTMWETSPSHIIINAQLL